MCLVQTFFPPFFLEPLWLLYFSHGHNLLLMVQHRLRYLGTGKYLNNLVDRVEPPSPPPAVLRRPPAILCRGNLKQKSRGGGFEVGSNMV